MVTRKEYEKAVCIIRKYQEQITCHKNDRIDRMDISVRSLNVLKKYGVDTISDFIMLDINNLKWHNLGEKTKSELKVTQSTIIVIDL